MSDDVPVPAPPGRPVDLTASPAGLPEASSGLLTVGTNKVDTAARHNFPALKKKKTHSDLIYTLVFSLHVADPLQGLEHCRALVGGGGKK